MRKRLILLSLIIGILLTGCTSKNIEEEISDTIKDITNIDELIESINGDVGD